MSDDRMDRAERIRNMREGNRGTDDETDDAATDAAGDGNTSVSTDDAATDASAAAGTDDDTGFSSLTTGADDETTAATDDSASTATSTSADTTPTASGTSTTDTAGASRSSEDTGKAASQAAEAVETDSTPDAAADTASDAQAAAQRAAESAAEVMGTAEGGTSAEAPTGTEAATGDDSPAVPAGATGASTVPGDISGVELPDQQLLEEAMASSSVESTEGGARAAMEGDSTQSEEVVRVLEFSLGDEYYCLDIEYVEEIVKRSTVTRVPNTPDFVDGVVDLRGQITTILEPKEMMDIESEGEQNLIIVFDPDQFEDQGAIGWVVDEVRQVVPIPESDVNYPPVDAEYINGVVDREEYDQFVIWVEPEDALAQATATEDE